MKRQRGFTLLEVVVALAILAITLSVLLEAQVSSLGAASRARDLTIAAMLARSKMVDAEQKLFDEGFTLGEVDEEGDFSEEGHPEVKWKYKISEVELDLSGIASLAGGGDDDDGGAAAGMGLDSMLAGLGGSMESLTQQVSQQVRVIELTVSWQNGKYTEQTKVRGLVTKDDFSGMSNGTANSGGATGGAGDPSNPLGGTGTGTGAGGTGVGGLPGGFGPQNAFGRKR